MTNAMPQPHHFNRLIASFHRRLSEHQWFAIGLLIVIGAILRFATSGMRVFVSPDSMAYWYTTQAMLQGDWINTYVERTPGYPVLLMLVQGITNLIQPLIQAQDTQDLFQRILLIFQSMLGITNALLFRHCVKYVFKHPVLAFYAGVAMLFLPDLLLYEHAFLTETLYTTGLLVWFWCFLSCQSKIDNIKHYLVKTTVWGFLTGVLILIKPIAMSIAICGVVWVCLTQRYKWQALLSFLLPVLVCILPWMMMNADVHGTFTLAAGRGANQLYKMIDDVDWASHIAGEYKIQLHQRYLMHPEGETYNAVNDVHVLMDQAAHRKPDYSTIYRQHDESAGLIAWEAILRHPFSWAYQTVKQWIDFFIKVPQPMVKRPLFFLWSTLSYQVWQCLLLVGGLGAILALWYRQQTILMASAIVISHATLYALTTLADARYHTPLEPLMLLLAVYLIWSLMPSNRTGNEEQSS